jgi:hypothetical protein
MNETQINMLSNSEFLRMYQDEATTPLEKILVARMLKMQDEIDTLEWAGVDEDDEI